MSRTARRTFRTLTLRAGLSALLAGVTMSTALAQTPGPTEDSRWYYEMGGAAPVSLPASPHSTRVALGGSVELGLGYSCASFDPLIAVSNRLNDIGAGVDDVMDAMTAAASSAIAALPALILQRANPGLYDLFQNALLKAEASVDVATRSCEAMEAEIARGKNPYADLITLSKGRDWQRQMGIGKNDPVAAKAAVEASNGANGIPWIGGPAGGNGQPPLRLTGDVVAAGYRVSLDTSSPTGDTPPAPGNARLPALWPDPEAAVLWVTDVVGESLVTTCSGCSKDALPGKGLLPKTYAEQAEVADRLGALVANEQAPTRNALEAIAAPGVAVSRQVIEAIRDMPATEQPAIVGRLVAEIATARVLERALMARRLLLTGRQVPEVYAASTAQAHVDTAIAELDREIDNLLFETRARREVVSDTVLILLERAAVRRQASLSIPTVPVIDPAPLERGRVDP